METFAPVLLAEDEENDIYLVRYAFQQAEVLNPLMVVRDGVEAVEYLTGRGAYGDRSRYLVPCLLITDIKMPRMNGFELLEWMQREGLTREIPAIAFSSSCHESDLKRALALGARSYKVKPSDLRNLVEFVREVQRLWLTPQGCRR